MNKTLGYFSGNHSVATLARAWVKQKQKSTTVWRPWLLKLLIHFPLQVIQRTREPFGITTQVGGPDLAVAIAASQRPIF